MSRLGAVLMILGAIAIAAALLAFAPPGLREVGFVLVGGVVSPQAAVVAGILLVVAGAVLRRRGAGRRSTP